MSYISLPKPTALKTPSERTIWLRDVMMSRDVGTLKEAIHQLDQECRELYAATHLGKEAVIDFQAATQHKEAAERLCAEIPDRELASTITTAIEKMAMFYNEFIAKSVIDGAAKTTERLRAI